ncbi:MAG: hypothetical protein EXQ94_12425, partial [Alphaproteobacteria bacterium]|nr:hypothetical protein [Alphaproteobacteria bacterium]
MYDYERESPAWRSLSGYAVKLLIALRGRCFGFNNGEIKLGVRAAAEELGTSPHTAGRAFTELQAKGFIRCTRASL